MPISSVAYGIMVFYNFKSCFRHVYENLWKKTFLDGIRLSHSLLGHSIPWWQVSLKREQELRPWACVVEGEVEECVSGWEEDDEEESEEHDAEELEEHDAEELEEHDVKEWEEEREEEAWVAARVAAVIVCVCTHSNVHN